jgi:NitT/TauT family transport system substrate-binding protein
MEDIRLIADELQDGVPGYATTKFMVLKDSPIQTIEDLRGKVLATNGVGGGVDIAMRAILRNHGLQEQRDYQDVEVAFPNMLAALSAKRVDMIGAVASIQYNPNLQAVARPLFTAGGELGPSESLMWAARAPYIQQNRPALVDFLEDTLRVQRWYLDAAHHGEAIGIIARLTKQKPEDIDWYFTEKDFYRDPNGRPDLDSVAKDLKIMRSIGLLKTDIDAAKYADLSLVKEAANRLKP